MPGYHMCSFDASHPPGLSKQTLARGAMGKETALLDLSSQQDWAAVERLLKDNGTKIPSKQINRVGRWAGRRLGSH